MALESIYINDLRSMQSMPEPSLGLESPFFWDSRGWWNRWPEWQKENRSPHYLQQALDLYAQRPPELEQEKDTALFTGSARGAESYWFEAQHGPKFSPYTTPGFLASQLSRRFFQGPALHSSQTCSSGLQAVLNGLAWLQAGFCSQAWVVASEYPIHPKTQALLKATGILCTDSNLGPWPLSNKGTVLASQAIGCILSKEPSSTAIRCISFGVGKEEGPSPTGISQEGKALRKAMEQCMANAGTAPDLVVGHFPGTPKGNDAEWAACQAIWGNSSPQITGTKWFTGHGLGASGMQSLAWVWEALVQGKAWPKGPDSSLATRQIHRAMINAQGFGGQAISIMVERI